MLGSIVTYCGPLETTTMTGDPRAADACAAGLVEITRPAFTVVEYRSCSCGTSRSPSRSDCASGQAQPTRLGTMRGFGPRDTQNETVLPGRTSPLLGDQPITWPVSTVSLYCAGA